MIARLIVLASVFALAACDVPLVPLV